MVTYRPQAHTSPWCREPTDKAAGLQSAFERRVLSGLAAEWENARWRLPDALRQSVRRPLFAIRRMPRRLGCWDPAKREITLSRELVTMHGWDDVREVLFHEMAHQVAHEGLNAGDETDHGQSFRQACGLLQANPRASGAYPTLRQRLNRGQPLDANDRMAIRIHKLMALAESTNPNEARAAMVKAHELIARYNIDLIRHGQRRQYTSIFLGSPRLRQFREAYHLAHLLQDYYFVQGIWVQAWVLDKSRMGRVLEISGSIPNVQIAAYVHESVNRYIDNTWIAYRQGKKLNRYRKTDFAVGIIDGFRRTLQKASENSRRTDDAGLPVLSSDRALSRYLTRRYPHIRSFSRKGPAHDSRVMSDGVECGKRLVVAKGVHHQAAYSDKHLEYNGE